MDRTIVCKMNPTETVSASLRKTLVAFAKGSMIALKHGTKAGTSNKVALQHLCYREIRKECGLSSNLAIRAIARAAWAMKAAKAKRRKVKAFRPTSIDYDARIFDFREKEEQVSLTTVDGRFHIPLILGNYQRNSLRGKKPTAAKLVLKGREWYIHIIISEDPEKKIGPISAIGVDRGIYNIAVTSTGKFFSGAKAMHIREKFASRRKALQRLGTRSAKRALKRLSGREHRYMRDVNHCISKAIVAEAVKRDAIIKMEDLDNIRDRTNRFSRVWRRRVHAWAFRELDTMVRYKAEMVGLGTEYVPTPNSSHECPKCHTVNENSRRGAHFKCVACGYRLPADLAAARTISGRHACPARAVVMQPMVSSVLHLFAPQKQAAGL
jgi:IS605 OrfB family transposase